MSVYKRQGSPFYQYEFIFNKRRYGPKSTKLKNRRAAERYENNLKEKLACSRAGIVDAEPAPLFGVFADDYLEQVKPELRSKSVLRYQVSLRSLRPLFGSKALDEISAADVENYKLARLAEGKSPSTVNRDLACLRRIFSVAVGKDKVGTTPFVARKVRFLKENGRDRILSFDEERRYLRVASRLLWDVATLILEMGLRPSEACSIRREDNHLSAIPPFLHIPDGKTKNAKRDVAVTARTLEVLKRRLAQAKGEYLFPLRVGRGFDWSRPMWELHPAHREALCASGITSPFQIYDLRHTYGTRAIEAGIDPLTLMRLMGHADLKTTMRYVHLSKRHLDDAQSRIERHRVEREKAEAKSVRARSVKLPKLGGERQGLRLVVAQRRTHRP